MQYVRNQVQTLAVTQAFGSACMLLAAGAKGMRGALPHARIKIAPPRVNRMFGSTPDMMILANELEYNNQKYVKYMAEFTGQTVEKVCVCLFVISWDCFPHPHTPCCTAAALISLVTHTLRSLDMVLE